jgi:hypothetical protein
MDTALVHNTKTNKDYMTTAGKLERRLKSKPDLLQDLEFTTVDKKVTLHFHFTSWSNGRDTKRAAHFAAAAGTVYKPHAVKAQKAEKEKSFAEKIADGQKILLTLNSNLSHRSVNFRNIKYPVTQKFETWVGENAKNYIPLSVLSAEQAVKHMRRVYNILAQQFSDKQELRDEFEKCVYAVYCGGVMSFNQFNIGNDPDKLSQLSANLHNQIDGVYVEDHNKNKTGKIEIEKRVIGLPKLFRFFPTHRTIEKQAKHQILGNFVENHERHVMNISQIIFSQGDDKGEGTQEYHSLREKIMNCKNPVAPEKGGIIVLASPSITWKPNLNVYEYDRSKGKPWEHMRLLVESIPLQTFRAMDLKPAREKKKKDVELPPAPEI